MKRANLLGWFISALLYLAGGAMVTSAVLPAPIDWSRPWSWTVLLLWPVAALLAIGAFLGLVTAIVWLLSRGDRR